jgi:subtilisin family serine protease
LLVAFCLAAVAAEPPFIPGQILVKPKARLSEPEFAGRLRVHSAWQRKTLGHINVRVLNVPEARADAVIAALRSDPGIEFAERDGLARAAFVPNDPYVISGDEWHLAKVQAPQAWNLTVGSASTVVAVLDSGINAAHPDLAGRILPGYNFLDNNADTSDGFGHGTAVAGVVFAAGNNGLGVAGIAYSCSALPVKVVDSSGFAAYSTIAEGIKYAVDQRARVINISISGSSPSSTLQDAVNYAWSNNVLVVAAAGNDSSDTPQYPAACDHVLAVSATEPDDSLAPFSSYGTFIALAAPGDNIWTTQSGLSNPYGPWRGTSFASPIVAGAAALVASANPSLSNDEIASLLESTADDLGPAGFDTSFGYGQVNAFRAVSTANPALAASSATSDVAPAVTPTSPTNASQTTAAGNALLTVQTSGLGRVAPDLNGRSLPIGKTCRLRAIPGPGQLFAGWNGLPSQSLTLTFTIQSNQTLVANFVPSPFPAVAGSYTGLLANTNAVTPESSGYFRLTVSPMGRFTGRLLSGGRGFGFHGQFNLAGDAVVSVARGQFNPLTATLRVDLTNNTDLVTGAVADAGWSSELTGNRNVFNALSNPALQAGLRAFILQPANGAGGMTATGSSQISAAGVARLRGKLWDQRAFAMASALARNGDCPFYLSLNRGSEVVIGWLNFPAGQDPTASGAVLWVGSGANASAAKLLAASAPQ